MHQRSRLPRATSFLLLGLLLFLAPACYGPFALTSDINEWNQGVGEKWANEAVFVGLIILPVYEIAVILDALLFNSLEFWTGRNPIDRNRRPLAPANPRG